MNVMSKIVAPALAALAISSCGKTPALLPEENFHGEIDGKQVSLYTLKGGDLIMQVTNYGGRVVTLWTPDRKGRLADIETGYENLDRYVNNTGERFLGAAVGPVANRIGKGTFTLDGQVYDLPKNDNGNTLHGGFNGIDRVVWDVTSISDNSITLSLDRPDGLEGFPGKMHIDMTYTLTEQNEFRIDYKATSDKLTVMNLSHHSFFNLTGDSSHGILDHVLTINADGFTPVDSLLIPTGEILPVEGTALDFREPHSIGERVNAPELKNSNGYDNNWVLVPGDGIRSVVQLYEPESGRNMEILTDQPGLQFYCGNFFDGSYADKYGKPIGYRCSLALETQKYPDSMNHEGFSDTVLHPGEVYTQTCIYKFSVK